MLRFSKRGNGPFDLWSVGGADCSTAFPPRLSGQTTRAGIWQQRTVWAGPQPLPRHGVWSAAPSPLPPSLHSAAAAAAAKSLQSRPTLCDPIDSSPPGSPVPGILKARTLEWVAISTLQSPLKLASSLLADHLLTKEDILLERHWADLRVGGGPRAEFFSLGRGVQAHILLEKAEEGLPPLSLAGALHPAHDS